MQRRYEALVMDEDGHHGQQEQLAAALGMPLQELEAYMLGEKELPNQTFITALEIVASGRGQE
jgi:hypothetical protein